MDILTLLKDRGLKATPQRIAVLEELSRKKHPTIDELYSNIRKKNPTISLATVYKNVNLLKDNGIVIDINTVNGKMRYDCFTNPHIHVVCKTCGSIEDLNYDEDLFIYQNSLEKSRGIMIDRLDIIASVESCSVCK